jgi:hypothetical protein
MHDLRFVREHPEVIEKMARDRWIALDLAKNLHYVGRLP